MSLVMSILDPKEGNEATPLQIMFSTNYSDYEEIEM
jgi:hypothetical protein